MSLEVTVTVSRRRIHSDYSGYVGVVWVSSKMQPVDICCDFIHHLESDALACGLAVGQRIAEQRGFIPPVDPRE